MSSRCRIQSLSNHQLLTNTNPNSTKFARATLTACICLLLVSMVHRANAAGAWPKRRQTEVILSRRHRPFPPVHITDEVDAIEENSVAKRNGLAAPPLIARRKRRQLQANQMEPQTNDTELDAIIAEAKEGEDPNARLRDDLVWSAYYDRNSYPWEYAWDGDAKENRTGVPVEMDINFHRVYSVDTINPSLDLIVWFRLAWVDPRLTWDPQEYGNHTKTWFWIDSGNAGGETSEIWTPDIELWNLEEGLAKSLEDAYAVVKYDGSVFWSRPGHLRPACKYSGLEKFPFDELSCTIELGSWSYSGMYMVLSKGGGTQAGFSFGGSETAGESYNEFSFVKNDPITCEVYVYNTAIWDNTYVYDAWGNVPDTKWPVVLYTVRLERSWQPYARGYIYSQILLIIIGFSAFWLPPTCGERMGLSITAMLASIASDIVIAGNLPQARELTWFQQFSIMNSMFVFLALIESVVVLYFFYSRADTMVPKWYTYVKNRRGNRNPQLLRSGLVIEVSNSFKDNVLPTKRSPSNNENGDLNEEEVRDFDDFVPDELSQRRAKSKAGSRRPESKLNVSVRDADDFQNEQEVENNLKWKEYAALVDDISRFLFPLFYAIAVAIILARAK